MSVFSHAAGAKSNFIIEMKRVFGDVPHLIETFRVAGVEAAVNVVRKHHFFTSVSLALDLSLDGVVWFVTCLDRVVVEKLTKEENVSKWHRTET